MYYIFIILNTLYFFQPYSFIGFGTLNFLILSYEFGREICHALRTLLLIVVFLGL
jgi:hypothetical protein